MCIRDSTHIEGLEHEEERKEIRKRAIHAGLKLVDCPIRHMGTEKAQEIYLAIERFLQENGVEIYFGYECQNLILENETCKGCLLYTSSYRTESEFFISLERRGGSSPPSCCGLSEECRFRVEQPQ